jgi:hypothetical protein
VGVDGVVFVGVHRGDEVHDLVVGHAHLRQKLEGDVVEDLTVTLHERARRAVLPVQIRGQAVNQVEVGFQFQDGLFVSHHTNSIPEPLFAGKYFLDLTLVLALSHSEGELFSIAPIVEEVLSRTHPSRFNCDLDAHNLRSGS